MSGKYNAKFPELKFMKNQSKSEKIEIIGKTRVRVHAFGWVEAWFKS